MHMTNEEHSHCGCGCGGHEHDHEHEHSHEHTHDGVTHTHAHTHEGEHQHDHTHGECGAAIITVNSRKMRIQQYLHTCLTITAIMLRSLQPLQSI